MLLKRIAVRDVAGIASIDLKDLDPGLNVLIGCNEAGKSTVLTALRAAIFHRHSSGAKFLKDLAPYGRSVRPEVDVEFELGGAAYRLEKRFLQRAEARLVHAAGELAGDAVEERLAAMFGFSAYSGRGEFELEKHQGAFGLLWVEQGRSSHGLDLGAGRDAVAASLEMEVGQILGGERGRHLSATAKALRDRHFTATGKVAAGSDLYAATRELESLEARLAEARALRSALDASIDRLADRRRVVADYRRERVIERAQEAVAAAEGAERGLETRRRDLLDARKDVDIAAAGVEQAAGEHRRRQDLIAAENNASAHYAAAAGRGADARTALERASAAVAPLEADLSAAVEVARAAAEDLRNADAVARRGDVSMRLGRLRETLAASQDAIRRAAAARAQLARGRLDEKAFKAIVAADAARREAAAGRDAGAPVLVFHPEGERGAHAEDGTVLPRGLPVPLTRRARFRLEGFGEIEVRPDAGSQGREAAYGKAELALNALLREQDLADLDAAATLWEATRTAEAELRAAEIELAARAPDGVAALEADLSGAEAELAALPEAHASGGDASSLRTARDAAEARLADARIAADAARKAETESRIDLVRAESAESVARAEAERAARILSEARTLASDAALGERLAAAVVVRDGRAVVLAARRAEYESADPAAIARELVRTRNVLAQGSRDLVAVELDVRELEAEIRQTGGAGIGEEIARLEVERDDAAGRLARLKLEAAAARLLHETLTKAEARVRRTWFAPIRREVEPYLKLVHPNGEVAFDDATLAITGLSRSGVAEDFRRLSVGAREQVAVVTRLALAQVLKRGGHPATVILDDALVNTDENRLERMHDVLRRAADDLQILILTCRERDFRDLGARIYRL